MTMVCAGTRRLQATLSQATLDLDGKHKGPDPCGIAPRATSRSGPGAGTGEWLCEGWQSVHASPREEPARVRNHVRLPGNEPRLSRSVVLETSDCHGFTKPCKERGSHAREILDRN